jgi:hypothetical protein
MKTLVIDSSLQPNEIKNSNNGFPTLVTASLTAWNHHCGLELEPFDFLVPLLSQFDVLNKKATKGTTKKKLVVTTNGYDYDNWNEFIDNILDCMKNKLDDKNIKLIEMVERLTKNNVEHTFFATGMLMSNYSNLFDYERFMTLCGFHSIYLNGSLQEWQLLLEIISQIKSINAEFNDTKVKEIITKIIYEYNNSDTPDTVFWNSMIRLGDVRGSGGYTYITGWLIHFFHFNEIHNIKDRSLGDYGSSIQVLNVNKMIETDFSTDISVTRDDSPVVVPYKMCGNTTGIASLNVEKNILKTKYIYSFEKEKSNENNKVYSHPLN